MSAVNENISLAGFQDFTRAVYGQSNDRYFSQNDIEFNIERFAMRGLKGIRKGDKEKIKQNLLITSTWFMSLLNQLHVNLEEEVWKRFPGVCSYCNCAPCACREKKTEERLKIVPNESRRPKTLREIQDMFRVIYPPEKRTLEDVSIHLAEEIGELSEALLAYRGSHDDRSFEQVSLEAADLFSCLVGVFNSLDLDLAHELAAIFYDNCHVCHSAPCTCNFNAIINYKS